MALLQMDLAWQDAAANRAAIERMIASPALEPGTFVLAPEMADTGFV
ncbi:MAG: amidohydrolase, partial [Phycisphaerae bacterium]|nr:amidohydrolase [Phycisphaerae bacterium]